MGGQAGGPVPPADACAMGETSASGNYAPTHARMHQAKRLPLHDMACCGQAAQLADVTPQALASSTSGMRAIGKKVGQGKAGQRPARSTPRAHTSASVASASWPRRMGSSKLRLKADTSPSSPGTATLNSAKNSAAACPACMQRRMEAARRGAAPRTSTGSARGATGGKPGMRVHGGTSMGPCRRRKTPGGQASHAALDMGLWGGHHWQGPWAGSAGPTLATVQASLHVKGARGGGGDEGL